MFLASPVWRRTDTIGELGEHVKRQCAELRRFFELPSNAVLCRGLCGRYNLRSAGRDHGNQEERDGRIRSPAHQRNRLNRRDDRLDSWKEIAAYLNRDVTTVQRWEKREGMPVHRHLHDRMGSVYAFRAELDAWTRSRNPRASAENLCRGTSDAVLGTSQRTGALAQGGCRRPGGDSGSGHRSRLPLGSSDGILLAKSHR